MTTTNLSIDKKIHTFVYAYYFGKELETRLEDYFSDDMLDSEMCSINRIKDEISIIKNAIRHDAETETEKIEWAKSLDDLTKVYKWMRGKKINFIFFPSEFPN